MSEPDTTIPAASGAAAVPRIVVMGVSGCGKSTTGAALGESLGVPFVDGDSLHSLAAVEKMAAGTPLNDDDRWPWLARVRGALRSSGGAVVACSALALRYRNALRLVDGVRFVFLDIDPAEATRRLEQRPGHFMTSGMVASQFEALERPMVTETDVVTIDGSLAADVVLERTVSAIRASVAPGRTIVAEGGVDTEITDDLLEDCLSEVAADIRRSGAHRILLIPPDHTRIHSRAGQITAMLRSALGSSGCEVGILPALGTHVPMGDTEADLLFGGEVPAGELLVHDWKNGLTELGHISAAEVEAASDGRASGSLEVHVDSQLIAGWDLVVSIGQVVPHEVIGMANYTKNVVIGLGGAPTIHRTHFVGAVSDMETIMGRSESPVRDLVDSAFDRFIAPAIDVLFVLTVVEDVGDRTALRGIYAGRGGTGSGGGKAYREAAALARRVNVTSVSPAWSRVACWMDPDEMRSTWLGNKAIYRTRMAMADGGVLMVLAPGVCRFGEDPEIDRLIRRHGYRGRAAVLAAIEADAALDASPATSAHLIHGSTEGRFVVVYCTDPDLGGLTEAEIRSVGYDWLHLDEALALLGVDGTTASGEHSDANGAPFTFLRNPAAGLWESSPS